MKTVVLAAVLAFGAASAQDLGSLDHVPARSRQYVIFDAEQIVVPAGQRSTLELRFRVLEGFHVNSHSPKSELLLPTTVELEAAPGVKTAAAEYPPGKPYSLRIDPTEKLDVYADDFTVKLPVVAAAGPHELHGALKYQACDQAACYPPRTLPITVLFTAK